MADIPLVRRPDGTLAEIKTDENGHLTVAVEGETQVTFASGNMATVAPELGAEGLVTRDVTLGQVSTAPVDDGVTGLVVHSYQGGGWVVDVQNRVNSELLVMGSDGVAKERLATHAEQLAQSTTLVAIQTALSSLGTEATLSQIYTAIGDLGSGSTLADLATALAPLATRASEATVQQIEDDVDGLEAGQAAGNAELAAINAGIPAALGQSTMAQSMPIVVASDQSPVPVKQATGNRRPNGLPSTHTEPVVVVTGAVKLRSLYAKITGAGARYLWVFDGTTTGDATGANAVPPSLELSVVLGLAWQTWPELGLPMSNGIVLALSSTQDTYTFSADSWTLEQVTWET